jgi:hypothetical protein
MKPANDNSVDVTNLKPCDHQAFFEALDCVFHVVVGTVSSGWWAVIPRDRGQSFQRMVGAHST